jgi:hypothetical protein
VIEEAALSHSLKSVLGCRVGGIEGVTGMIGGETVVKRGPARKYELLASDCIRVGDRTVYRIRALRDFGDVRRGDLGGYIESESALAHSGQAWVHDAAQVYGPNARVSGNARVRGEAWILGRVDGDAQICDLAVIAEHAHVGGRTIVCSDEIVSGESRRPLKPARSAAMRSAGPRGLC